MWKEISVLSDGECVSVVIRKGTLIIVCDGLYYTNLYDNIRSEAWVIHCTDTDRNAWGPLLKTSQVAHT